MPAAREQADEGRLDAGRARGSSEATWPCRWSTGASGSRRDQASAFAAERPTSSAPISPGPRVTATSSTSSSVASASLERLARRRAWSARGAGARRPRARRRRSGHADPPGRRRRSRASVPSRRDARRGGLVAGRLERRGSRSARLPSPRGRGRRDRVLPHDVGVLAVVRVVAAPDTADPKPAAS